MVYCHEGPFIKTDSLIATRKVTLLAKADDHDVTAFVESKLYFKIFKPDLMFAK